MQKAEATDHARVELAGPGSSWNIRGWEVGEVKWQEVCSLQYVMDVPAKGGDSRGQQPSKGHVMNLVLGNWADSVPCELGLCGQGWRLWKYVTKVEGKEKMCDWELCPSRGWERETNPPREACRGKGEGEKGRRQRPGAAFVLSLL